MRTLHARWALTEDGWVPSARVRIDDGGRIAAIEGPTPEPGAPPARDADFAVHDVDVLLPGMPNGHCHAFQYGVAGLTERASGRGDSFWTWRERMYASIDALDPEGLRAIATQLYARLRQRGYTSVAEFHYVHRAGGASAAETADALVQAARAAGMRLLLLPVLYRWGGFGRTPLSERQQRFALDLEAYGRLLETLAATARTSPSLSVGIAPHSLRAVDGADLDALVSLRAALLPGCPVHIHIAEQRAEVEAARQRLGTTPVRWLCEHAPVDASWTMVHATHADADELRTLARRGATVCVCTTTEANLGDGAFDLETWWSAGGGMSIGSDSNVGIDPTEELRWLEYQARLRRRERALLVDDRSPHPGVALWRRAVAGGRRSFGVAQPGLSVGAPAELLGLSVDDDAMTPDEALDDFVFARRATEPVPLGEALPPSRTPSPRAPGKTGR